MKRLKQDPVPDRDPQALTVMEQRVLAVLAGFPGGICTLSVLELAELSGAGDQHLRRILHALEFRRVVRVEERGIVLLARLHHSKNRLHLVPRRRSDHTAPDALERASANR